MRRDVDPNRLLHGLLDRFERQTDRTRRITARPAQAFSSVAGRDALAAGLSAAADAGAVTIEPDRDAPHLVARVILIDAPSLYAHLDRTPADERDASALDVLRELSPETEVGWGLHHAYQEKWLSGRTYLGTAADNVDEAVALIRIADAAFAVLPGGPVPLRTRSTRLLGDSKAIERSLSKLLAHLRLAGLLDMSLDREGALQVLGLSKFPQPVLVAGPLTMNRIDITDIPYVGLPPETIASVDVTGGIATILTVENLESFHRQVREARRPNDLVVYCGGFPAPGVVHAVRHLVAITGLNQVHHWGDVDAGGVRIGRFLEEALGVEVAPHLMTEDVARTHGRPAAPMAGLDSIPECSSFGPLARFLSSSEAHVLEQEVLDPVPIHPCNASPARRDGSIASR